MSIFLYQGDYYVKKRTKCSEISIRNGVKLKVIGENEYFLNINTYTPVNILKNPSDLEEYVMVITPLNREP